MDAKQLLQDHIVIDLHLDLATHIELERSRGNEESIIEKYYDKEIHSGGVNFIVSAIGFASQEFLPELAVRKALRQIIFMKQEIERLADRYALCTSFADMLKAQENGQVGIILMMEGGDALLNDLSLLDVYYDLGVRILSLVWSRPNYLGTGAALTAASRSNRFGLTDFGLQVLERMEKLGMIWDITHLNDAGFADGMQTYHGPVMATHSACRALSNVLKNNTDEQILQIGQRGGVIGANIVNFIVDFEKMQHATIADYVGHLRRIRSIAGIQAVGFGFDFCNKLIPYINERNLDQLVPSGKSDIIDGYSHLHQVVDEMIHQGFSEGEILQVIGGNFMEFFRKYLR